MTTDRPDWKLIALMTPLLGKEGALRLKVADGVMNARRTGKQQKTTTNHKFMTMVTPMGRHRCGGGDVPPVRKFSSQSLIRNDGLD